MTDFSHLIVPDNGQAARDIHLIDKAGLDAWLKAQPENVRNHVSAARFAAKPHEMAILPDDKGTGWSVLLGVADISQLKVWCLAKASEVLAAGHYRIVGDADIGQALVGWALGQYRFSEYRKAEENPPGPRILLTAHVARIDSQIAEAEATADVRDMVNTPAEDMGPGQLEARAKQLAETYQATLTVTRGDALETGYPMIHAVGRAASREHAPRLIELVWGRDDHPKIAVVGKGVCFDSGGLDIKSATGMLIMKKDMGGGAHALALAQLIMRANLPVRLHLLVAAVENAISSNAFRPGDVLRSRSGISVEIGNTDAEGRLVLGDALTKASESAPELILDFATLTGAVLVALGNRASGVLGNNNTLMKEVKKASEVSSEKVWELPLWEEYTREIKGKYADIKNIGEARLAGTITAGAFLKEFVDDTPWVHMDIAGTAWGPKEPSYQPKVGATGVAVRLVYQLLENRI